MDKRYKYIIVILITGVVIAGGVYLYIRNKKLVTKSDALKVFDFFINREGDKLDSKEKETLRKETFVDLYKLKMDKVLSDKLLLLIKKSDYSTNAETMVSKWTKEEKADFLTFNKLVLTPYLQMLQKNKLVK